MMRHFRRLPLRARALWLLALLFWLASLGVEAWAVFREHQGLSARQGRDLFPAFVLLSLACIFPGAAYNVRFRRALPWLYTWRGQLAVAVGLALLPLGFVAAVLLIPPNSPQYMVTFLLGLLAMLVMLAAYFWIIVRRVA